MRRRACAALAVVALAGCEGVLPEPDFERMLEQRNLRPYVAASWFADGRAMRPPPLGTISRERELGRPALTDGVVDGRDVTAIPVPVDRALLARGRDRFDLFCATCHGVTGDGQSPVARNMELRRPPSLIDAPVTTFLPGRVFRVISAGYGLMPSYRTQLPATDRWAVVAYLKALQLSRRASLDALPAPWRARAQEALR